MRDTKDMAREAGFLAMRGHGLLPHVPEDLFIANVRVTEELNHLVALVRADERWEQSKRRGVLVFCPYTGRPRHPSDIASDPHGILILVPDQPLRGEKP
jgi:hypothetical protein